MTGGQIARCRMQTEHTMLHRPAAEPLRENSTGPIFSTSPPGAGTCASAGADAKVHVLGSGSGTTQKDNEKVPSILRLLAGQSRLAS